MEKTERKEWRDDNWVCRIWLQIKSCRECLFDAFCTLEDNKHNNDQNKEWDWEREWD